MIEVNEKQIAEVAPDLFAIHKAPGWSIHNHEPSLLADLKPHYPVLHFINRIDLETSGLVLFTTQPKYVEAFQAVKADKIYRALTSRPRDVEFKPGQTWTWSDPMTDSAEGRRSPLGQKVHPHPGKQSALLSATSQVQILRTSPHLLDLEVRIETGRQHQIRKHCAHHRMPIVGDPRYGSPALNSRIKGLYQFDRQMLHAWKLMFQWQGCFLEIEATLPHEFNLIQELTP